MRVITCLLIVALAVPAFADDHTLSFEDNVKKVQDGKWWKKSGVFTSKDGTVTFCVAEAKSEMLQVAIDNAVLNAAELIAKENKTNPSEVKRAVGVEVASRYKGDDTYTAKVLVAVLTETLERMAKK